MPTETVYGLAGLALNEDALARIFAAKDRPTFDPLIVHVARPEGWLSGERFDWLAFLAESKLVDVARLDSRAKERVQALTSLWPGPLTLVLPKQSAVPDLATSGLPTVAIRAPRHPVAQSLLRAVDQPLAAPSANRFGRISPTSAADVRAELGDRIELILDGGSCEIGLESTVVQVAENGDVTLLRPGAVDRDTIERLIGAAVVMPTERTSSESQQAQPSPGLLASHYAPVKPLFLLPAPAANLSQDQFAAVRKLLGNHSGVGVLLYSGEPTTAWTKLTPLVTDAPRMSLIVRSLSSLGDANEAARNLFRKLRELDAHPAVQIILAEPPPDEIGLGHAIADRLRRASGGNSGS